MQRFWDKVQIKGENDCWEWQASIRSKKTGYGCFKYMGKVIDAHRMSWFLTFNEWPKNLICHSCDNKLCVNPNHLWEGTYSDNLNDAIKKGINLCGGYFKKYNSKEEYNIAWRERNLIRWHKKGKYQRMLRQGKITKEQFSSLIQ